MYANYIVYLSVPPMPLPGSLTPEALQDPEALQAGLSAVQQHVRRRPDWPYREETDIRNNTNTDSVLYSHSGAASRPRAPAVSLSASSPTGCMMSAPQSTRLFIVNYQFYELPIKLKLRGIRSTSSCVSKLKQCAGAEMQNPGGAFNVPRSSFNSNYTSSAASKKSRADRLHILFSAA